GVPIQVPAMLVQRVCGTGIEALIQAGDAIKLGKTDLALCVGAESMSRNPVAAYTHRGGFAMGQVEFKDFLFEALLDPAASCTMGQTAENVAKKFGIKREEVDRFAADSFARALEAQKNGFVAGEIVSVVNESFDLEGYNSRVIKLPKKVESVDADTHPRPTSLEVLAKLKPVFGGVQTAGSSSGVVDGAAAALVASGQYVREKAKQPLARIVAGISLGVPPEIMGIGPVPAIQELLRITGLKLSDIDRVEINEAFGAQCLACERELGLDHGKLNVNGGSIAIGHPLAATGIRITVSLARELKRSGKRYGISSACIGGGQGIALLIENVGVK
ncbi:MAG TPA: thiolase family protein, partial [Steroidobacteraceae bacterium]|nr:thiolase family protein [Steroidobacteraceae bacterium]